MYTVTTTGNKIAQPTANLRLTQDCKSATNACGSTRNGGISNENEKMQDGVSDILLLRLRVKLQETKPHDCMAGQYSCQVICGSMKGYHGRHEPMSHHLPLLHRAAQCRPFATAVAAFAIHQVFRLF